jgi:hypothetical protein
VAVAVVDLLEAVRSSIATDKAMLLLHLAQQLRASSSANAGCPGRERVVPRVHFQRGRASVVPARLLAHGLGLHACHEQVGCARSCASIAAAPGR